ncbi:MULTISPECIES: hypothetical protein [Natrialbaceae]|uniref:hypothetical protein n=1 Tax=Natrialbaceae TaxID=1644061 RepID=UPI00207C37E8|nr:hypothetical protein [Natronococcus sp. CG52]
MKLIFEPTQHGLEIIDPVERHRYSLTAQKKVIPEATADDQIPYPVDEAVEIEVNKLSFFTKNTIYIYDSDGSLVAKIEPNERMSLPENEYVLDLSGPMKVYAYVKSSIDVYSDTRQTYIDLSNPTSAILGARSHHTRPAGTITTTSEPTDVMRAVSTFGSALKTMKPERSYPTLRGHPPALEIGNELDIPSKFERSETGIHIEIPPSLSQIFTITPLAYYLGAKIVPSSSPQLLLESDDSFELDGKEGLESTVERVLKKIFFLDCVVRSEGTLPSSIQERDSVESALEFDIKTVYEQPLAKQLQAYLDVPFAVVEPYLPDWRESRLTSSEEMIPFLPFISGHLTTVKTDKTEVNLADDSENPVTQQYTRSESSRETSNMNTANPPIIEQLWKDKDSTETTTKTPLSAFYNSISRTPRKGPIEIKVICNDRDMFGELVAIYGTYGDREELPFEVTVYHELTKNELKEVFSRPSDFVHYIGHIEDGGFQCENGELNAWTLETVGTKAFLLNACQSYNQGLALVEAGSTGGIVTLEDIDNRDAISVGSMIARLLNQGFPLYGAIDVAREKSNAGEQYQIVGNGKTTVAQYKSGCPVYCIIEREGNLNHVKFNIYSEFGMELGSIYRPYMESVSSHRLVPKEIGPVTASKPEIVEFLEMGAVPVLLNGTVKMSNDISLREL